MKDSAGHNHYSIPPFDSGVAFGDHGQIEPVTDGRDSEACIVRLKERFRFNDEQAAELVDEILESFGGGAREEIFEDFWKIHALEDRAWLFYQAYIKNNGDRDMAFRCCLLLLGYKMSAGADSQRGLVKLLSFMSGEEVTKAAVNKAMSYFKRKLPELPYFREQRSKAARKKMSGSRNKQLTK
jgi:ribosomal protein S21